MATNITNPKYAGEEAAGFISASLLSGETLGKGYLTVLPNVSYKVNLKSFDLSTSNVVDASCDFTAAGDVNYTEKALTPGNYQLNQKLCKKDWLATYAGASMNVGVDATLPSSFEEYVISHAGALVGQEVEKSIWTGVAATTGEFAGFETLLADAGSGAVKPTHAVLDSTNIIAQLRVVRDAIPTSVYGKEDVIMYMSTKAYRLYVSAQAQAGYLDKYHVGVTEANFEGINLAWCPGMSDDCIIAARKSNMFFATDLVSDMAEVKLLDQSNIDGSDNVHLVMRYNAGVGFATGGDIVYYNA